jgi:predicted TIM-barrel fold metal-dependent hydrolase
MTIDVWLQHPTERFITDPVFESLRRWVKLPAGGLAIEATLAVLDSGGIEKALICSWHGPAGALISNREVYEWTRRFPDRLYGLASVDLASPMKAIATLNEAVKDYGFKGLRIVQWLWDKPCTHPLYYPLFAECVRLNVPVCLQVGLTGPLCSSETGRPLHIERVALDFPDLKIVCGHIGYPWQQEMIAIATKFPNVYIDTSAYKSKRYPPELVSYLKTNGRGKVMFGSNYPMITPKDCLEGIDSLEIPNDVLDNFLSGTARSVFQL